MKSSKENLTNKEIKLLSIGGNQRLKYFLLDYSLPQFSDSTYKYLPLSSPNLVL